MGGLEVGFFLTPHKLRNVSFPNTLFHTCWYDLLSLRSEKDDNSSFR